MTQFKVGDIVRGPSIPDPKIRTWKIQAISQNYASGQNTAAKKPYRHPLDLTKMELMHKH